MESFRHKAAGEYPASPLASGGQRGGESRSVTFRSSLLHSGHDQRIRSGQPLCWQNGKGPSSKSRVERTGGKIKKREASKTISGEDKALLKEHPKVFFWHLCSAALPFDRQLNSNPLQSRRKTQRSSSEGAKRGGGAGGDQVAPKPH